MCLRKIKQILWPTNQLGRNAEVVSIDKSVLNSNLKYLYSGDAMTVRYETEVNGIRQTVNVQAPDNAYQYEGEIELSDIYSDKIYFICSGAIRLYIYNTDKTLIENKITIYADAFDFTVRCVGQIRIEYTLVGEKQTQTFSDLINQRITINGDMKAPYVVYGNVQILNNTEDLIQPTYHDVRGIEVNSDMLAALYLGWSCKMETVDLHKAPRLSGIQLYKNSHIRTLCLGYNTLLKYPNLDYANNMNRLKTIYMRCLFESAADNVAYFITHNWAAGVGTIYTDPTDPYYQTVKDAADQKGWSVKNLYDGKQL